MAAVLALFRRALGWGLSLHKGQLGGLVSWIGFEFRVSKDDIAVSIKKEFMEEYERLVRDLLRERKIPLKVVQSFAGKTNHISNLLIAWRPFIDALWAAIYSRSALESGKVWQKQIKSALDWLLIFMHGHRGTLTRSWSFVEFLHPRAPGTLYLDASPWGLGGVLVIDSRVHSFFGCRLTREDENILNCTIGSDESQQIFESLVILVAMKLWVDILKQKRIVLTLTSDNTSALAMTAKLKITASQTIARELALLLSETAFQPRVIQHLPGVMNGFADSLSRLFQPGGNFTIPAQLAQCKRLYPPRRCVNFYTTLAQKSQGGEDFASGEGRLGGSSILAGSCSKMSSYYDHGSMVGDGPLRASRLPPRYPLRRLSWKFTFLIPSLMDLGCRIPMALRRLLRQA